MSSNLISFTARTTQQSPAPFLPTFCLLFQCSVMLLFIEVLLLFQLLPPTTVLGEPLLRFCLLCVCALPFSPSPQESLCNVRQPQQKEKSKKSKKQTLEMKPWTPVGLCSDVNDETLPIRVCTFGFTPPFSVPPPRESLNSGGGLSHLQKL